MIVTLLTDKLGDVFVPLSSRVLKAMNWKLGDEIVVDVNMTSDTLILHKKGSN